MDILKKPEEYAQKLIVGGYTRQTFLDVWKSGEIEYLYFTTNYLLDVLDAMKKIEEENRG